jgi:hypothetical protein
MTAESPKPPAGLGPAGRARWRQLTAELEFQPHELVILEEACRVVDVLARLRRRRPSPKTDVEVRLQQEQLRKLLGGINWPDDGADKPLSQWGRTLAHRRWRG